MYRAYFCISDLILVFRILYLYFRTYYCISDLILILQVSYTYTMEHILVSRILYLYYGTYSCFIDMEVPVGTREILLVQKYP